MLAVNRVANALGSSYPALFASVTSQHLQLHQYRNGFVAFCGAFRGFCFLKTRFSNLDKNVIYKFHGNSLLPPQHHTTKIIFCLRTNPCGYSSILGVIKSCSTIVLKTRTELPGVTLVVVGKLVSIQ